MKLSSDIKINMSHFHELLDVETNFDIVYHTLTIGGRQACFYFVDGLTKDEVLLRLMQAFASIKPESMPENAHDFSKQYVSYGESGLEEDEKNIVIENFLRAEIGLAGHVVKDIGGFCVDVDHGLFSSRW